MQQLSIAYIIKQQQVLVDRHYQLPKIMALPSDLVLCAKRSIIARSVLDGEPIPTGYQWVHLRQLLQYWDKSQFNQASLAVQLLEWQRNYQYCGRCGHKAEHHLTPYFMTCPACEFRQYPRINPCVITLITRGKDEILLAKSARANTQMYTLIAGFVEVAETLEDAVRREVLEEVGLHIKNIKYLASQSWPFPHNLMLAFHAEYDTGDIVLQEEEISDAQFFKFDQLPEIPVKGSIAHAMIMHITHATPILTYY